MNFQASNIHEKWTKKHEFHTYQIHPIKAIVVKKNKPCVPRLEGMDDSGHEPSDEEELRAYQAREEGKDKERGEIRQSFTQPPLPTSHEEEDSIPPQPIED